MGGKIEAETPEQRLAKMGLALPPVPAAAGNYAGFVLAGNLLVVSGQLARRADGKLVTGRAGADLPLEQAQEAARLSALNILAQVKAAVGDLSRVAHTLRIKGFVQATLEFTDHPKVINGASDLIGGVLGAHGIHSRAAVGAYSLPLGSATEIDAMFLVA